jgi:hypothetical protein
VFNTSYRCNASSLAWVTGHWEIPAKDMWPAVGLQVDHRPDCEQEAAAATVFAFALLGLCLTLTVLYVPVGRRLQLSDDLSEPITPEPS